MGQGQEKVGKWDESGNWGVERQNWWEDGEGKKKEEGEEEGRREEEGEGGRREEEGEEGPGSWDEEVEEGGWPGGNT